MDNKETILGKLYFIRAALSGISLCNDKAEELVSKKKAIENSIEKPKITDSDDKEIQEDLYSLKEVKEQITKKDEELSELNKKILKANDNDIGVHIFLLLLSLALSVGGILLLNKWRNMDAVGFGSVLSIIARFSFIPFIIIAALWDLLMVGFVFNSNTKAKIEKTNLQINADIQKIEEEKNALLKKQESIEIKIQHHEQVLEETYQSSLLVKQERITEITNLIGDTTKEALLIYENLKKNSILDERDWEYLDLIIYEVETGRADSIKESLQQADLYNRHDELQYALTTATAAICNTIRNSLSVLAGHISNEIGSLRESVSSLASGQQKLSERLIDSQEMTNALLSKQNETSESLVRDISRIKEIQDLEYYGIKIK